MQNDIDQAVTVLKAGGIILYPTDTVWGIGCNAINEEAVKRIYKLKQREEKKGMLILVEDVNRILRYVKEVPEIAWQLMEVSDTPITIVYQGVVNLAKNIIGNDDTIGIRVVKDEFCKKLIAKLNQPLVSTSANISGQLSPGIFKEISDEVKNGVDYIVKWRQNDIHKACPSSIIKVGLRGEIEVIRK
jgi:L-threonylcarbamoyladenylate synthase